MFNNFLFDGGKKHINRVYSKSNKQEMISIINQIEKIINEADNDAIISEYNNANLQNQPRVEKYLLELNENIKPLGSSYYSQFIKYPYIPTDYDYRLQFDNEYDNINKFNELFDQYIQLIDNLKNDNWTIFNEALNVNKNMSKFTITSLTKNNIKIDISIYNHNYDICKNTNWLISSLNTEEKKYLYFKLLHILHNSNIQLRNLHYPNLAFNKWDIIAMFINYINIDKNIYSLEEFITFNWNLKKITCDDMKIKHKLLLIPRFVAMINNDIICNSTNKDVLPNDVKWFMKIDKIRKILDESNTSVKLINLYSEIRKYDYSFDIYYLDNVDLIILFHIFYFSSYSDPYTHINKDIGFEEYYKHNIKTNNVLNTLSIDNKNSINNEIINHVKTICKINNQMKHKDIINKLSKQYNIDYDDVIVKLCREF